VYGLGAYKCLDNADVRFINYGVVPAWKNCRNIVDCHEFEINQLRTAILEKC